MARIIYTTTYSTTAIIKVKCEACGHEFAMRKPYRTTHQGIEEGDLYSLRGGLELQAAIRRDLEKGKVRNAACPKCGYIQSWLEKSFTSSVPFIPIVVGVISLIVWCNLCANWPSGPSGPEVYCGFLLLGTLLFAAVTAFGVSWARSREKAIGSYATWAIGGLGAAVLLVWWIHFAAASAAIGSSEPQERKVVFVYDYRTGQAPKDLPEHYWLFSAVGGLFIILSTTAVVLLARALVRRELEAMRARANHPQPIPPLGFEMQKPG